MTLKYKLIRGDSVEFEEAVNAAIADGWSLHGPTQVVDTGLIWRGYQAMTKAENPYVAANFALSGVETSMPPN